MQEAQDNPEVPLSTAEIWQQRLNSPLRMSLAVIGALLAIGIMAVYMPLSAQIESAAVRARKAETRRQLARDVEELRRQAALYAGRIPHGEDLNAWTDYLHRGVAQAHVTLLRMSPQDPAAMAQGKLLRWKLELEGNFASLGAFVDWIEHGERVAAVESIILEKGRERMSMTVVICGLVL